MRIKKYLNCIMGGLLLATPTVLTVLFDFGVGLISLVTLMFFVNLVFKTTWRN